MQPNGWGQALRVPTEDICAVSSHLGGVRVPYRHGCRAPACTLHFVTLPRMGKHDGCRITQLSSCHDIHPLVAGVLLSREALEKAAHITARAGAWLIMDNTYEHFVYEGLQHHCISAPHIIHLFSFSKVGSTLSCALHPCSSQSCSRELPPSAVHRTWALLPAFIAHVLPMGARC